MAILWTGEPLPSHDSSNFGVTAIAYSPTLKLFVALSGAATARGWTSPDGRNWTFRSTVWPNNLNGDGYALGKCSFGDSLIWDANSGNFLAVITAIKAGSPPPDNHTYLLLCQSPDGINWTRTLIADLGVPSGATAASWVLNQTGGTYVAVGFIGTTAGVPGTYAAQATSILGPWTLTAIPAGLNPHAIVNGGGQFVAVGFSTSIPIVTSPDGLVWTGQMGFDVNFINKQWNTVAFGNGSFVMGATSNTPNDPTNVANSGDGATWLLGTSPHAQMTGTPNGFNRIVYDVSQGFVGGVQGQLNLNGTYRSIDNGVTWIENDVPDFDPPNVSSASITGVTFASNLAGGVWVAAGVWFPGWLYAFIGPPASAFYYNPSTNHFQCAAAPPGPPWILQDPTLTITGISPDLGPVAGGTAVTITGTGFADGLTVTLGGVALLSVVVVDQTTITGVTPPESAGLVDLVITQPSACSGSATRANAFRYYVSVLNLGATLGGLVVGGSGGQPDSGGNPGGGQSCEEAFGVGADSGGGTGCEETFSPGTDSGGGSGCEVT